jgi:hypothetical protein
MATPTSVLTDFNSLSESDKLIVLKNQLLNASQYLKEDVVDEFYTSYGVVITITNPSGSTPAEKFIRPIQPTRPPRP